MSIVPYNFEPLVSDADLFDYTHYEESSVNYNGRSKLNVSDWCLCRKCENQLSDRECVCCYEHSNIFKMCLNDKCITENPSFSKIILDEEILRITKQFMISKSKNKNKQKMLQKATQENKTWRYICYKQFTLWVNSWTSIGKGA